MQSFDAATTIGETVEPSGLNDPPPMPLDRSQPVADMLQEFRDYLLLVANAEVPSQIRPKMAASDLVQQSLAEAWEAFDQFRGQNHYELRGWLRRILLNNLRDATRRYGTAEKRDAMREVPLPDGSCDEGAQVFAANDPSPSAVAMANEERTLLHAALARLPEHYAQIIRLRNLEFLSFPEIGLRMQLERDLARKLWERAVKRLSNELRQTP